MAGENGRFMLQNLPFMILKNIFSYFPYVSMFKFSKLCILFREVAVHRMRLGFAKLLPIIQSKCAYFNGKCEHLFSSMLKGTETILLFMFLLAGQVICCYADILFIARIRRLKTNLTTSAMLLRNMFRTCCALFFLSFLKNKKLKMRSFRP